MLKLLNSGNLGAIFILGVLLASVAFAAPPQLISYQGKATDGSGVPVADGPHNADFRFYDDEFAGFPWWGELAVAVTTTDGLFSYNLGTSSPLSATLFTDIDELWLDITFDGEVQSPRTRLTGTPFAQAAISLYAVSAWGSPGLAWNTDMSSHAFVTYGFDGLEQVRLWGGNYGEVLMHDGSAGNPLTAVISAGSSGGGFVHLKDGTGANAIMLNGYSTPGDGSVILPQDAIESVEMLNEPGFATNINTTDIYFALATTTMVDLVTITVTIPSAGYIVLKGLAALALGGTTGANYAIIQIDETAGGADNGSYYVWTGHGGNVGTSLQYFDANCMRSYFKGSAGTYTFRMEGRAWDGNSAGAITSAYNSWISAEFYPTAYGPTNAIAESPAGFDDAEPIEINTGVPLSGSKSTQTAYLVDLRQLELRATRLRLETEKAERELDQARLDQDRLEQQRADKK